jgi:serine/threonine-protein kinase HipA
MELTYDARWLDSAEARPLSLSLPMNLDGRPLRGERVAAYFDNLLPDSDALRQRIRARFQTQSTDAFDLLEAIGRDCVGAVQLLPDGRAPEGVTRIDATRLDDAQIEALLRGSTSAPTPFDDDDDFRISLAGAQEKTALTWHRGRWCRPHAATPTTHIFKLPLGLIGGRRMDMRHSLENEWLCAKFLAGFGVPVADSEVRTFGDTRALVVTRKRYRLLDIERRHFNDLARRCGFGPDMESILEDVIARTDAVIAAVARLLPADFPLSLFDTITRGLANAARRLERMPPG